MQCAVQVGGVFQGSGSVCALPMRSGSVSFPRDAPWRRYWASMLGHASLTPPPDSVLVATLSSSLICITEQPAVVPPKEGKKEGFSTRRKNEHLAKTWDEVKLHAPMHLPDQNQGHKKPIVMLEAEGLESNKESVVVVKFRFRTTGVPGLFLVLRTRFRAQNFKQRLV